MERYDATRVKLHASEQKFIYVMTGSYLDCILRPEELRQHLQIMRYQWRDREDVCGAWTLALLFIEDLCQEATWLVHSNRRN